MINQHKTKFCNCYAYYFDKIDRDPGLFPKHADFVGIQAKKFCQFKYAATDHDGRVMQEPGYVLARPLSDKGPWTFHDFLPHTRPPNWGKRCQMCSNKHCRPVHHTRPGEPVTRCMPVDRQIVQPDASAIDVAAQPMPRAQQRRHAQLGPDAVFCSVCNLQFKKKGLSRHMSSKHPGLNVAAAQVEVVAGGAAGRGGGRGRGRGRGRGGALGGGGAVGRAGGARVA